MRQFYGRLEKCVLSAGKSLVLGGFWVLGGGVPILFLWARGFFAKSLVSLSFEDVLNFVVPTPSRGRPPPHRKISELKSLGSCSFSCA